MKQSRKDFIKQAHESACGQWKKNIEDEFPKLFKKDLIVGKWYKTDGLLQNFLGKFGNDSTYGFRKDGVYSASMGFHDDDTHDLATDKEVEQALNKEAKKRGFKEGIVIITSKTGVKRTLNSNFFIMIKNNLACLSSKETCVYPVIFTNGTWATIVETITKEQAEKELGKTIIN
tara:strand:- start:852 stop:1373 length:522 start_codon:yes stop_codon:yes gene_type:complete